MDLSVNSGFMKIFLALNLLLNSLFCLYSALLTIYKMVDVPLTRLDVFCKVTGGSVEKEKADICVMLILTFDFFSQTEKRYFGKDERTNED